jgi:hypothetical protein
VRAIIALLCSVLVAGCDSAPAIAPGIGAHRFGETFTTAAGKLEIIPNQIGISYEEVSDDSRCPKNVTCVWQGAATVNMVAMVEGDQPEQHRFQLATAPESARSVVYKGFRVELIDVTPHPDGSAKPAPEHYRVSLRVTRAP